MVLCALFFDARLLEKTEIFSKSGIVLEGGSRALHECSQLHAQAIPLKFFLPLIWLFYISTIYISNCNKMIKKYTIFIIIIKKTLNFHLKINILTFTHMSSVGSPFLKFP